MAVLVISPPVATSGVCLLQPTKPIHPPSWALASWLATCKHLVTCLFGRDGLRKRLVSHLPCVLTSTTFPLLATTMPTRQSRYSTPPRGNMVRTRVMLLSMDQCACRMSHERSCQGPDSWFNNLTYLKSGFHSELITFGACLITNMHAPVRTICTGRGKFRIQANCALHVA